MDGYPDRIRYIYVTEPNVRLRTAHGVWGGVTPHGEIELSFYDESECIPDCTEQEFGPDGAPGPELMPMGDGGRRINRHVHSRILLNGNTARAVLEWLEARVEELEAEGQGEIYAPDTGPRQ